MTARHEDHRDRQELRDLQSKSLLALLDRCRQNPFYLRKYAAEGVDVADVASFADLQRLPFTTKAEIIANQDQYLPYGDNRSVPRENFRRMHQTSGTAGRPLVWLDTDESWRNLLDIWSKIFRIIDLNSGDRLFFPFSFGPFLGFWTAFEAASTGNFLAMPGGGMSTSARLRFMRDHQANVVFCTPTYALRMAEIATQEGIDLRNMAVRKLVVAGEPGGSVAGTRARIEEAWNARVFDHAGMTEVGPMSIECPANPAGLHLIEIDYIAEVIDPRTTEPIGPGNVGELVVTNFCRPASPLIRYRTGDLVRVDPRPCPCGSPFVRFDGGILGRVDDMIQVRGNNLYPSAIEGLLRRFPEVVEYRIRLDRSRPQSELCIEIELSPNVAAASLVEKIERAIRDTFLFRADIKIAPPQSLPRFEMKAQRFVRTGDWDGSAWATRTP